MATWRMVARVIGVAVLASCAEMPTDLREQPDDNRPPPEMQTAAQANGAWPSHEPAGMSRVFMVDGSTTNFGPIPGIARIDPSRVSAVSDPTSKYGRAIEKRYRVGDGAGWGGGVVTTNFPGGPYRELYFRIVFRVSSNWQWHKAGGKYLYYGAAGRKRGDGATQFVLGWQGDGTPFWTATGNGRHVPNGVPKITRDKYHTVEIHHVASTSGANGSLHMWVDGVKVQSFSVLGGRTGSTGPLVNQQWYVTRDMADKRLDGIQAFMFWGGQGDVKRVSDWVRLSELYISGKK